MVETNIYYKPTVAIKPGEFLKEALADLGMSQTELSERIDRPQKTVNEIINGKTAITSETALQLEKVLNIPAHYWSNLQTQYQEIITRQLEDERMADMVEDAKKYPYSEMAKFGWVEDVKDEVERVKKLLYFFGVTTFENVFEEKLLKGANFRVSEKKTCSIPAMAVWLRQGVVEGRKVTVGEYTQKKLIEAIPKIRTLTLITNPDEMLKQLRDVLADCGVIFVLTKNLTNTPINGATRWLNKNPLLQMTIRNAWVDIFWFSLFHEIGHVLQTGKSDFNIDIKNGIGIRNEAEEKADKFAQETLIPDTQYYKKLVDFIRTNGSFTKSKDAVNFFAKQIDIHPGIIVGRLQHDRVIGNNQFNDLRVRYIWK